MAKPAYLKGFLWFTFSGTAMLSAFILPIHIWALSTGGIMMDVRSPFLRVYFLVLILSALYHGLYRTKTIIFDVGITKHQKIIGYFLTTLFCIFAATAVLYFLIIVPRMITPVY